MSIKTIDLNSLNKDKESFVNKPKIVIFGIGGAGGNAVNNMISSDLKGVEFVAANTDAQSLEKSLAENKIQLGVNITKGLGAGSFPNCGREAAEESIEEINRYLEGANMVFISAGMGGGTGTGAAPVVARLAHERNILTVGVVTKPFYFEGSHRMEVAEEGVDELKKHVDTLIVIPNQNLFRVANEQTTFESAFKMADDVLHAGVRGVTDLITMPGIVNLDFADIRTVMTKMGKAMMGTGQATGENRAVHACEEAISNPLLDDVSIKGAKGVLVNMTGGPDMTLFEAEAAVSVIKREVDDSANIIFGSAFDESMEGSIRVSVVATGIDSDFIKSAATVRDINNDDLEDRVSLSNKSFIKEKGSEDLKEESVINSPVTEVENSYNQAYETESEITNQDNDNKISDIDNESVESSYQVPTEEIVTENNSNKSDITLTKDSFFEPGESNDEVKERPEINFEEKPAENINPKIESNSTKSSNSGFSLFGFMNNAKKGKDEEVESDANSPLPRDSVRMNDYGEVENNVANQQSDALNDNSVRKFFDSDAMSNDNEFNRGPNMNDDVLNIPSFFRKKK